MPKTIPQQPDIARKPNAGDLLLIEKAEGGTRKIDFDVIREMFRLKILWYKSSADGVTEIPVPGLENSTQAVVIRSMQPLEPYEAIDLNAMPGGFFKAYYSQNKIVLNADEPLFKGEKLIIIHN